MDDKCIGLDIGGANIKYADLRGKSGNIPFELWKRHQQLAATIESAIPEWDSYKRIAVTMTGELADCFESKQSGIAHICNSINQAASARQILFYQTDGKFVDAKTAIREWRLTAAANWHALASFVGNIVPDCMVIDIGSTTTDIIPVRNGKPIAIGTTDLGRLQNGELLYTGTVRSPVCAVAQLAEVDNQQFRIAQELFATMQDVYIVLGKIPEGKHCRHTADGRPATRIGSLRRLARMLCADTAEISETQLLEFAEQVASRQFKTIQRAIETVSRRVQLKSPFVSLGEGSWLADEILISTGVDSNHLLRSADIGNILGPDYGSHINTASAIAWLADSNVHVVG